MESYAPKPAGRNPSGRSRQILPAKSLLSIRREARESFFRLHKSVLTVYSAVGGLSITSGRVTSKIMPSSPSPTSSVKEALRDRPGRAYHQVCTRDPIIVVIMRDGSRALAEFRLFPHKMLKALGVSPSVYLCVL